MATESVRREGESDLEELQRHEQNLRYRPDSPTGRANSTPVPDEEPEEEEPENSAGE